MSNQLWIKITSFRVVPVDFELLLELRLSRDHRILRYRVMEIHPLTGFSELLSSSAQNPCDELRRVNPGLVCPLVDKVHVPVPRGTHS